MIESTLPMLYGRTSKGIIKQWEIIVSADDQNAGVAYLHTRYGQINGKKTESVARKIHGKNIGRSNQTTPWQQAQSQAESKWKKQLDSNYRETIAELDHLPDLPMLALRYKDRSHDIKWPAFAQPKLNGVRCFAKKIDSLTIEYTTRKGKKWETLGYMDPYLLAIMDTGETFDGEIFNPTLTFQEITSRAKRVLSDRSNIENDPVQFHVFDIVDRDKPFDQRWKTVSSRIAALDKFTSLLDPCPIVAVPTRPVQTEAEFFKWHTTWTAEGYEGSMVRNINGLYVPDYRSADLQKHKDFIDEEFEIVGGKEGEGKDEGTIIFKCITEDGKTFDTRPKGSWELRHKYWNDLPRLHGKMLTVRYQNLSDEGIPIFPIGLNLRDYE